MNARHCARAIMLAVLASPLYLGTGVTALAQDQPFSELDPGQVSSNPATPGQATYVASPAQRTTVNTSATKPAPAEQPPVEKLQDEASRPTTIADQRSAGRWSSARRSSARAGRRKRAIANKGDIDVRTGPGSTYPRFEILDVITWLARLETPGAWAKIRLPNGSAGWIGGTYQRHPPTSTTAAGATASNQAVAHTGRRAAASGPAAGQSSGTAAPYKPTSAAKTNVATAPAGGARQLNDPSNSLAGLLVDTKKDPFAGGAGVGVGVGDAFKLLLYLLPILGLIVLAVRGLKRFQEKTGWNGTFGGGSSRGGRSTLFGGLNLINSRKVGGSNIRVVESVPVGNMELSLVEVRGRMLLLSNSGASVTLITELKDGMDGDSEFQALLGSLTDDDDLDAIDSEGLLGATIGSLDDSLRDTREAIVRTAARTLGRKDVEWQS